MSENVVHREREALEICAIAFARPETPEQPLFAPTAEALEASVRARDVDIAKSRENVKRATRQEAMEQWDDICYICRAPLGHVDVGTLDCNHAMHAACYKQWAAIKKLCPCCKVCNHLRAMRLCTATRSTFVSFIADYENRNRE